MLNDKKHPTQLSGDEYRNRDGKICPYCLTEEVTTAGTTRIGSDLYQEAGCNKCMKSWHEKFFMIDYVEQLPSPQS